MSIANDALKDSMNDYTLTIQEDSLDLLQNIKTVSETPA